MLRHNKWVPRANCQCHFDRFSLRFGSLFGVILRSDGEAEMSISSTRNTDFRILGLSETRSKNMWRKSIKKVRCLVDVGVHFGRFFRPKSVRKSGANKKRKKVKKAKITAFLVEDCGGPPPPSPPWEEILEMGYRVFEFRIFEFGIFEIGSELWASESSTLHTTYGWAADWIPQRGATAASHKVPGLLGSERDDEEGKEGRMSMLSVLSILLYQASGQGPVSYGPSAVPATPVFDRDRAVAMQHDFIGAFGSEQVPTLNTRGW